MKNREALLNEIAAVCSARADEPMTPHTSFRVGGPADIFAEPENAAQLAKVIEILKAAGVPYFTLGNGTNVLVRDAGVRGAVIKIGKGFSYSSVDGLVIKACGACEARGRGVHWRFRGALGDSGHRRRRCENECGGLRGVCFGRSEVGDVR